MEQEQEVIEQEVVTQDDTEARERAAEDVFNAGRGGPPASVKEDATQLVEPVEPETAVVAEVEAEQAKEELRIAGYTESEIKILLEKASNYDKLEKDLTQTRDRLYGIVGNLKQQIEGRQSVKLTGAGLKRFAQEYGEDAANLLAEDLAEFITQGQPAPSITQDDINTLLQERLNQAFAGVGANVEERLLTMAHPDWKTVKDASEFRTWLTTKPANYQKTANETEDALQLASVFTDYKSWKTEAQAVQERRQKRLEQAVAPEGTSARAESKQPTPEDGWNAARRIR